MRSLAAIYRREVKSYFASPLAYVLTAVYLLLSGYFFTAILFSARSADLGGVLGSMGMVALFLAPLLTMRALAEERRNGTDELLLTAPVGLWTIAGGKYLALVTVFLAMVALTGTYPLVLTLVGSPDWGAVASGYLGLLLLGGAFLAVGLFASALTATPMLAAVVGFALLLGLWVLGWAGEALPGSWGGAVARLSLLRPYEDFRQGLIDTRHLVFYATFIAGFLFLTVRALDKRRWA